MLKAIVLCHSLLFPRVCESVGIGEGRLNQESVDAVFHTLTAALRDYTTDARGDIGVV